MAQRIRWGIVSTANIAVRSFLPALREIDGEATGVASRSLEKANVFAAEHGITKVYGSYEALLDDPEIEAVYIALPNTLHAEWIVRAAAAGKHVFCEKPLTMTADEARRAVFACEQAGVLLVEAFVFRHHRQSKQIRAWLDDGLIGDVQHTSVSFHAGFPKSADNIRLRPEVGGGAFLDLGCYVLNWTLFAMGGPPTAVAASWTMAPSGVDRTTMATLRFEGERTANVSAAFGLHGGQHAKVYGSSGTLEVTAPFHPRGGQARVLLHKDGTTEELLSGFAVHPFTDCVAAFERAARGEEALTFDVSRDMIDQARTMDAVRSAARSHRWVEL